MVNNCVLVTVKFRCIPRIRSSFRNNPYNSLKNTAIFITLWEKNLTLFFHSKKIQLPKTWQQSLSEKNNKPKSQLANCFTDVVNKHVQTLQCAHISRGYDCWHIYQCWHLEQTRWSIHHSNITITDVSQFFYSFLIFINFIYSPLNVVPSINIFIHF